MKNSATVELFLKMNRIGHELLILTSIFELVSVEVELAELLKTCCMFDFSSFSEYIRSSY